MGEYHIVEDVDTRVIDKILPGWRVRASRKVLIYLSRWEDQRNHWSSHRLNFLGRMGSNGGRPLMNWLDWSCSNRNRLDWSCSNRNWLDGGRPLMNWLDWTWSHWSWLDGGRSRRNWLDGGRSCGSRLGGGWRTWGSALDGGWLDELSGGWLDTFDLLYMNTWERSRSSGSWQTVPLPVIMKDVLRRKKLGIFSLE